MSQSLFGTPPTISFPDEADATYNLSTRITFAVNGTVTAVRFWGATNAISSSPKAAIYNTSGVLQNDPNTEPFGTYQTAAWNVRTLATPFAVTASQSFDFAVGPLDRYVATSGALPVVSGDLTGVAGRFIASASVAYPNNLSGGGTGSTWYGIDILFTATNVGEGVGQEGWIGSGASAKRATGAGAAAESPLGVGVGSKRAVGNGISVEAALGVGSGAKRMPSAGVLPVGLLGLGAGVKRGAGAGAAQLGGLLVVGDAAFIPIADLVHVFGPQRLRHVL